MSKGERSAPKNHGQDRKEEVHKRNEERKLRKDNEVFLFTDDEGAQTPVLLSKLYVVVYPVDGNEDAAFLVTRAALSAEGKDATAGDAP